MPMSKASELQWCAFLRKVLPSWKNHEDIYLVSLKHHVPPKRIEKVVAWALREQVIRKSEMTSGARKHTYIVDQERAMLAIKRREARVTGEEITEGVDWGAFETMWRGLIQAKQRRTEHPDNAPAPSAAAMETLALLQDVIRES